MADAIKDCTGHGKSVLDAFCGSGTTIIVAEKVGRKAFGKKRAVNSETGLTFSETEARLQEEIMASDAAHPDNCNDPRICRAKC